MHSLAKVELVLLRNIPFAPDTSNKYFDEELISWGNASIGPQSTATVMPDQSRLMQLCPTSTFPLLHLQPAERHGATHDGPAAGKTILIRHISLLPD